ncbi:uncharacterized protein [Palaemon carinicauda]|uniref:uncharacterized protein n=1 Tax=Palaemon carinicauda TaxID=392227 RepID=UPI0035B5797C
MVIQLIYGLILVLALHGACVQSQWLANNSRAQQRHLFWHRPIHTLSETRSSPWMDILWNPPGSFQGMPHSRQRGPSFNTPRLPPARATGGRYTQRKPAEKSSTHLASILDPFGVFSSQGTTPGRPGAHRTFTKKVGGEEPTEEPPPMVYFPEGGSGACQDFNPSGFNTYSFLSFLFSVANLVGLIANNVNNNLRNNNNNNNDNNNNLGNINVANSNSNQNNENSVDIPAAMGRRHRQRRRRSRRQVQTDILQGHEMSSLPRVGENITALPVMDFIEGMRLALLATDEGCALRNFCEVNSKAVTRGPLSDVISEVFSQALADMYPKRLPTSKDALLLAGLKGRNSANCNSYHAGCQDARWHQMNSRLNFNDLMLGIPLGEVLRELELEDDGGLLRILSVMAYGSGLPLQRIK